MKGRFIRATVDPRILTGIAALVMLTCCGGLFYAMYTVMGSAVSWKEEAEPVADQALIDFATNWNAKSMRPLLFEESKLRGKPLEQLAVKYKEQFGSLRSHEPFLFTGFRKEAETENGAKVWAETHCEAKFQKIGGSVWMTLVKKNNEWKVDTFEIFKTGEVRPSTR